MFLEFPEATKEAIKEAISETNATVLQKSGWTSVQSGILAGSMALTAIAVLIYLKRVKH